MSLNQILTYLAIAGVLLLTVISLINFELFVEWAVKAIIAAFLITIFVRASMGKKL